MSCSAVKSGCLVNAIHEAISKPHLIEFYLLCARLILDRTKTDEVLAKLEASDPINGPAYTYARAKLSQEVDPDELRLYKMIGDHGDGIFPTCPADLMRKFYVHDLTRSISHLEERLKEEISSGNFFSMGRTLVAIEALAKDLH